MDEFRTALRRKDESIDVRKTVIGVTGGPANDDGKAICQCLVNGQRISLIETRVNQGVHRTVELTHFLRRQLDPDHSISGRQILLRR